MKHDALWLLQISLIGVTSPIGAAIELVYKNEEAAYAAFRSLQSIQQDVRTERNLDDMSIFAKVRGFLNWGPPQSEDYVTLIDDYKMSYRFNTKFYISSLIVSTTDLQRRAVDLQDTRDEAAELYRSTSVSKTGFVK